MKTVSQETILDKELRSVSDSIQEEASWQEDAEAQFGRIANVKREIFELTFKRYLALYQVIRHLNEERRLAVFRGEESPNAVEDKGFERLFEEWLKLSDPIRQRAEFYERHCREFGWRLHEDLQSFSQEARRTLREWQPAHTSTARAFRTRQVTRDEASALGLTVGDSV